MTALTVEKEIKRLNQIFKNLPPNKYKVAEGLIVQAARMRVRLDMLWNDIVEHGDVEFFSQSEKLDPYERERPCARLFTSTDKNYQQIIKQLIEICPDSVDKKSKLELLKNG